MKFFTSPLFSGLLSGLAFILAVISPRESTAVGFTIACMCGVAVTLTLYIVERWNGP